MGPVRPAPSPADAYYNQRHAVAATSDRLRRLREAIKDPINLSAFQWAQWFAYVREYRPDLVLELGRGNGNSTAAVNEALHQLGHGRLVSFCLTRTWHEKTVPLLRPFVEADWFDRIEARVGNLLQIFKPLHCSRSHGKSLIVQFCNDQARATLESYQPSKSLNARLRRTGAVSVLATTSAVL